MNKEKLIFALKCLLELVEKDQIRLDQVKGKTTEELIELAEEEAKKAIAGSEDLKNK